jgi:putative effector of murein hydrolase LrgA (UPF0299 family)
MTVLVESQVLNVSWLSLDDSKWLHRLMEIATFVPMVIHVVQNWKSYTAAFKRGISQGTGRKLAPQLRFKEE